MPCFFNNASCNALHTGNDWNAGAGANLCSFHYQQLSDEMTNNGTIRFNQGYLNDYLKISLLMRDTGAVLNSLARLNTDMGAGGALAAAGLQMANTGPYVKISAALEYFENKCWFPSVHMVLVGLLPGDDFLRLLRSGIPVKDVGAGANHGEFSHRLQWFAIMRLATADFTIAKRPGWYSSPYNLYCSFGEGAALTRNVWGMVLDKQGAGDCRDPSYLDDQIRRSGLANLAGKLSNVRNKRFQATTKIGDFGSEQARKEVAKKADGVNPAKQQAFVKLGDNYSSQLMGAYYTMKRNIDIKNYKVQSQVSKVIEENSDPTLPPHKRLGSGDFDLAQALPKTSAIGILKEMDLYQKPDRHLGQIFSVVMDHGALLRTGETLPTAEQVQARRLKSLAALKT